MKPVENTGPLSSGEVGQMLRVTAVTVARWADEGKLASFRTPGGHRRFHRTDIEALLRPDAVRRPAGPEVRPPHPPGRVLPP